MTTQLDSLRQCTTVVADTGDFEAMRAYRPTDATTNPSLILKAVQQAAYRPLLARVLADPPHAALAKTSDLCRVAFAQQILDIVPGRAPAEVDPRLSFDTRASVGCARHIIQHYEKAGVPRERVLIKLA